MKHLCLSADVMIPHTEEKSDDEKPLELCTAKELNQLDGSYKGTFVR
jgi:hypothetical protein